MRECNLKNLDSSNCHLIDKQTLIYHFNHITVIFTTNQKSNNHIILKLQNKMNNAKQIPSIFYGTAWKKDKTSHLVQMALKAGFRAIDTACQPKHYHESGVGDAIINSPIPRDQIFIQTKFTPYPGQDPNNVPYNPKDDLGTQVRTSFQVSLKNLRTDHIDSLVLHSPMRTLEYTIQVWKVFQEFVNEGKVTYLGISNCYDVNFFEALYNTVKIKPKFIQNRFYKESRYDIKLREFCQKNDVIYQSFWTLTANPALLNSKLIRLLCEKHKRTPAEVLYRILTYMKIVPLIGTKSEVHMKEDLSIFDFQIEEKQIKEFEGLLKEQ